MRQTLTTAARLITLEAPDGQQTCQRATRRSSTLTVASTWAQTPAMACWWSPATFRITATPDGTVSFSLSETVQPPFKETAVAVANLTAPFSPLRRDASGNQLATLGSVNFDISGGGGNGIY